MKKQYLTLVAAFLIGGLVSGWGMLHSVKTTIENKPEPAFHEHADFAMYLLGERFDFSKDEFMSVTPCKIVQEPSLFGIPAALAHGSTRESLKDDVHLHDNIGGVVHSHKEGIDWSDFFVSIGMEFTDTTFTDHEGAITKNTDENTFRFFLNGQEVLTISDVEIRDNDKVLISYGPKDRVEKDFARELASISNDACYYSETCLHRGDAPYESCGNTAPEKSFIESYLNL